VVMYVRYIMFFCRYTNHVCISHSSRTNHGDECDLPPTIHTPYIFGKAFLLVRNIYDRHIIMILNKQVHKDDVL
jgi:hypothetical protein